MTHRSPASADAWALSQDELRWIARYDDSHGASHAVHTIGFGSCAAEREIRDGSQVRMYGHMNDGSADGEFFQEPCRHVSVD